MMKLSQKKLLGLALIALSMFACSYSAIVTAPTIAPTRTIPARFTIIAATPNLGQTVTPLPTVSATPTPQVSTVTPQPGAKSYQFGTLGIVVPGGVANTVSLKVFPGVQYDRKLPWLVAPPYILARLVGYPAPQDSYIQPLIYIYPAQPYADVSSRANINLKRLRTILANPSLPMTNDVLPWLPFTPGEPSLAAQTKVLSFKGGSGVRFVTQYDIFFDPQVIAPGDPIVNQLLFYHFEGLSSDGKSYIIAILPVSTSLLANDPKPDAAVPTGGIPYPGAGTDTPRFAYFGAVRDHLNAVSADAFSPPLDVLDQLVSSLSIAQ